MESAGQPRESGRAIATLRPGEAGIVSGARLEAEDAALLRAMGLRPRARVRVCRTGEPCIVVVECREGEGCRIGLARRLAQSLMVEPVA